MRWMKNDTPDRHGSQQKTGEKHDQPPEHPPDTTLGGQNTAFGLQTVGLPEDS
jgi:hypothetical protein